MEDPPGEACHQEPREAWLSVRQDSGKFWLRLSGRLTAAWSQVGGQSGTGTEPRRAERVDWGCLRKAPVAGRRPPSCPCHLPSLR